MSRPPVPLSFYQSNDVVAIAKNLIGKGLFTHIDNTLCGGIIIETEAYAGINDRASHAYAGRRTARTEVMYGPGGYAYIYFCYGMHYLLNAVTALNDTPHAVLIRAILPTQGIEKMMNRRKKDILDSSLCGGPATLCQALGITKNLNGSALNHFPIMICDLGYEIPESLIHASSRIGIDYAGLDASLPYRFHLIV